MTTVDTHGPDLVLHCTQCGDYLKVATPEGNPLWFVVSVCAGYEAEHEHCRPLPKRLRPAKPRACRGPAILPKDLDSLLL